MGKFVVGKEAARAAARAQLDRMKKNAVENVKALVFEIDTEIKALTPVWSGQAVANYIWTTGQPHTGVEEPIDNGPPGPTNSMPLGTEPRRAPNEAAAAQSLDSINFGNPFQTFILTNNSPDIQGLELGRLPEGRSRSPNGMFGLVSTFISAKVAAKGLLS